MFFKYICKIKYSHQIWMIQWHQYNCHCELALEEQFSGQPFHTNFTAIGHFHWFDIPGVQCMTFTLKGSYIHKGIKWLYTQKHTPALQVSTSQCSITANLWSLTVHIYHVMIIVTSGFSKKFFSIIIFRSNCMQLCYFKTSATRNSAIFACDVVSL